MAVVAPSAPSSQIARASGRTDSSSGPRARLAWCVLALAAGLFFALRTSAPALQDYYVFSDDARQHVFWIPRLHDPDLFRDDPIADYFAAQAPPAFVAIYFLGTLALDAVTFSKLLPIALTLALSGFAFLLGWRLFRRASAAGLGAALLASLAWQYDDLASGTPRSFATPLLVAFLAFLVAEQRRASLATLTLQALIYPIACPIMLGTQALWLLGRARRHLFSRAYRPELAWLMAAAVIAVSLVLLEQRATAGYGPVVSADQAREMAEFRPGGRSSYFFPDPSKFWLESRRSGLALVMKDRLLREVPAPAIPFALATALCAWALAGRIRVTSRPPIPSRSALLLYLLTVSFILFFAAHALFFRLYWPARQLEFSLPIVWALGGGLMLALAAERLAGRLAPGRPAWAATRLALVALGLLIAHGIPPKNLYEDSHYPRLYEYLRAQPKDTLVAALPDDSSDVPLLAQRPVLASWKHVLPFHPGYYQPLRRRNLALLGAYYAESPRPIVELSEREGVGMIVANTDALERYRRGHGNQPLGLESLVEFCSAMRDDELVAIPLDCARRAVAAL